ncbi:hypothetical protein Droror1_Dr00018896 [Drosera rotundifolia]
MILKKKEVQNYEEEDGSVYCGIYDVVSVDGRYGVVGCLACGFVRALGFGGLGSGSELHVCHFLLPVAKPSWRHTVMCSMDMVSARVTLRKWCLTSLLVMVVEGFL